MSPKSITLDTTLYIPKTVDAHEINDEMVLINFQTGDYIGFDPMGTNMWKLIQQHKVLRKVFDEILLEFDVSPERLEIDILEFANQLVKNKLAIIE